MITLLRHAPLPIQYQKRYIGHSDINIDYSLVDKEKIKKLSNINYDLLYSSDLMRCQKTLKLITTKDFIMSEELREVKFKSFIEEKNFDEISKLTSYDEKYLESEYLWHSFICDETKSEFQNRLINFINNLPKNKNILICTHAGVIKELAFLFKKEQINTIDYLETYSFDLLI